MNTSLLTEIELVAANKELALEKAENAYLRAVLEEIVEDLEESEPWNDEYARYSYSSLKKSTAKARKALAGVGVKNEEEVK
jgi:hypothetical protein